VKVDEHDGDSLHPGGALRRCHRSRTIRRSAHRCDPDPGRPRPPPRSVPRTVTAVPTIRVPRRAHLSSADRGAVLGLEDEAVLLRSSGEVDARAPRQRAAQLEGRAGGRRQVPAPADEVARPTHPIAGNEDERQVSRRGDRRSACAVRRHIRRRVEQALHERLRLGTRTGPQSSRTSLGDRRCVPDRLKNERAGRRQARRSIPSPSRRRSGAARRIVRLVRVALVRCP